MQYMLEVIDPASKEPLFDCPKCKTKLNRNRGVLACSGCGWAPSTARTDI
jgi:uncharacterized Zn finger protein (UPF0148 family)